MMNLILSFIFMSSAFAQSVEFEIPMFSKKVQEQGKEIKESTENCSVDSTNSNGNTSITCGTEKIQPIKKPKLGTLDGENSQFAQDKVEELRKSR